MAARQAEGYNLPWHEIVLKERAEKGPAWMIMNNSFYESLKFKQPIHIQAVPKTDIVVEAVEEVAETEMAGASK